jgi:hypothetical protein
MVQRLSKKNLFRHLSGQVPPSGIGLIVGWCIHSSVSEEITASTFSVAQTSPVKANSNLPDGGSGLLRNGHDVQSKKM